MCGEGCEVEARTQHLKPIFSLILFTSQKSDTKDLKYIHMHKNNE